MSHAEGGVGWQLLAPAAVVVALPPKPRQWNALDVCCCAPLRSDSHTEAPAAPVLGTHVPNPQPFSPQGGSGGAGGGAGGNS